jgi:hypothetical protein
MSSSKKLTCKGTLRQVFICLKLRNPYPPLHTVYVYTVYPLQTKKGGRGWRVKPQRRGEDGNSWFEYTDISIYLSIYSTQLGL